MPTMLTAGWGGHAGRPGHDSHPARARGPGRGVHPGQPKPALRYCREGDRVRGGAVRRRGGARIRGGPSATAPGHSARARALSADIALDPAGIRPRRSARGHDVQRLPPVMPDRHALQPRVRVLPVPGRPEYWCAVRNCRSSVPESIAFALRNASARLFGLDRHVRRFVAISEFHRDYLTAAWASMPSASRELPAIAFPAESRGRPSQGAYVGFAGRFAVREGRRGDGRSLPARPGLPMRFAGDAWTTIRRCAPARPGLVRHDQLARGACRVLPGSPRDRRSRASGRRPSGRPGRGHEPRLPVVASRLGR